MQYQIGICDDEKSTCAELEKYVIEFFSTQMSLAEVFVWYTGESCLQDLHKGIKIDILFLDIEFSGKNGVEIGRHIRETMKNASMHIIFISTKTNYALELFKIHPYDFLIKPLQKESIWKTLSHLLEIDELDKRFYTYTNKKMLYKIPYGKIMYMESRNRHIRIYLSSGEIQEFTGKIKTEISKLPPQFVMVAQSYIINLKYVVSCGYDHVIMHCGEKINVSQSHRAVFRERLRAYNEGV